MAQLGPNDIEAKFVLTDQMTSKVKDIEKNLTTSTEKMSKSADKTSKVFDKWNFSLNALKLGMKGLNYLASHDANIGDQLSEAGDLLANSMQRLLFLMAPAGTTMQQFSEDAVKMTRSLAHMNLKNEMDGVADATARVADIPASAFHELLKPFFETGDAYKQSQEAFNGFANQLEAAQEKVRFLITATGDLADHGLGLTRKEAEALWASMQKVKDAYSKSVGPIKDVADAEDDAAAAARRAREAQEELLKTFSGGWDAAVKGLEDDFLVAGHAAARFAKETHSTISNDLFAALKGEAFSFGSFMSHILDNVTKQFVDAASAAALLGLTSGIGGLFGGGGSTGISLSGLFGGGEAGGVGTSSIGSTFGDFSGTGDFGNITNIGTLPHLAGGGVADGPSTGYLAVLHGREEVTPVGVSSASTNVTVNLYALDTHTAAAHLRTPEAQKAIGDAVMRAMKNRGDVRGAVYDG